MPDFYYRPKDASSTIAIGPFPSEKSAAEAAVRAGIAAPDIEILDATCHPIVSGANAVKAVREAVDLVKKLDK